MFGGDGTDGTGRYPHIDSFRGGVAGQDRAGGNQGVPANPAARQNGAAYTETGPVLSNDSLEVLKALLRAADEVVIAGPYARRYKTRFPRVE